MNVKWANMNYKDIIEKNLMPDIESHLASMDKFDAAVYRTYLRDWCAFPKNFAPELLPVTPDQM